MKLMPMVILRKLVQHADATESGQRIPQVSGGFHDSNWISISKHAVKTQVHMKFGTFS